MSARSAYSRKVNAKKHNAPILPAPRVPAPPPAVVSRHESHDNFDVNHPPERSGTQSSYSRPQSISQASSHDVPRTAPTRSNWRQAYEEQSEKVRNTCALKLTGKPEKGNIYYREQQVAQQETFPSPPSLRAPSLREQAFSSPPSLRGQAGSPPSLRGQAGSPYAASSRSSGTQPPRTRMPRSNTSGLSSKSLDPMDGSGFEVKKFLGHAKQTQPWMKLRHDPELWDDTTDTVVYFGAATETTPLPEPSFRLSSTNLAESSESNFFLNMLREGHIYESFDQDMPPSPTSSPDDPAASNYLPESQQSHPERQESVEQIRSPRSVDRTRNYEHGRGEPTPPLSSDNSRERKPGMPIRHELYFPISAVSVGSKEDILREHLSIRNVFAVIHNKSLVGLNLFQALCDLLDRMNQYMPGNDNKAAIIEYIYDQGLEDVRNDPESAISLLAWSELKDVEWMEGWREGFVHAVGMYNEVKELSLYPSVSVLSRHLIQQKANEIYLRTKEAEKVLRDFDLKEIWPMSSANPPVAKQSFLRFQASLQQLYQETYIHWPPKTASGETWLNREITQRLQEDFAILYDFVVDRSIIWEKKDENRRQGDDYEGTNGAKQLKHNAYEYKMVKKNDPHFTADLPTLPIVDMLIKFDLKHAGAHIPHPFPLTPDSTKPVTPPKKSFFGSRSSKNTIDPVTVARRTELAYSTATNVHALSSISQDNALIKHFMVVEYGDKIGEVDPYDARLGRWILLYGILQILSHISGDTPGIMHNRGVKYYLNPNLHSCPPWEKDSERGMQSFNQELSHCWLASKKWEAEKATLISTRRKHHEIKIADYEYGIRSRSQSTVHPSSPSLKTPTTTTTPTTTGPTLVSSRHFSPPSSAPENIVGGVVPNISEYPRHRGADIPPVPVISPTTPRLPPSRQMYLDPPITPRLRQQASRQTEEQRVVGRVPPPLALRHEPSNGGYHTPREWQ
ncbi:MAG: hypothetical protein M1812_006565 [Candelaria pacifica]|nr:MAG: hypothetical protein M1812_006565 [Candelaria pacifica]